MNTQARTLFVETFQEVLKNRVSKELGDGVLCHYRKNERELSSLNHAMKIYLDVKCRDRQTVFVYKGRMQDLNRTKSVDVTNDSNLNQSNANISRVPRKKSSTGSLDGNIGGSCDSPLPNLDGSPLKLQAFVDLSAFDSPSTVASPTYVKQIKSHVRQNYGIQTKKAKIYLSMFCTNFSNINTNELIPDFWILCDASDIKSTAIMGVQPVLVDEAVGIRTTTVTVSETDLESKKDLIHDMSSVSDAHCYARYDVIQATKDERAGYQGSLAVDLEWKRASHLMQKPPSHATAFVKASVTTGDMRSPAYSFYQELILLKSFVSAVTTGDVNWIAEKSDVPLIESIKELIEQLRQGDRIVQAEQEDDTINLISPLENLYFKERQDLDFTDHLWKVLITCSAYSDLVSSLQYVFSCLGNGRIQPMVHNNNHTTMAQLVRDSYTGRMMAPPLKGVTPIKLLVEMGAEKLKRDYINAFLSTDLTTLTHLNHLTSAKGSLENLVEQLEKQQNVLEMVSMLKMFLSLPHASLSSSARQMLKHYETNAIDDRYIFEFPVPTSSMASVLETGSPSIWKARFDQTIGAVTESTVYCVTSFLPFPHVHKRFDIDNEIDDLTESDKHFLIKKQDFVTLF